MADLLKAGFWPIDKVLLVYLSFTGLMEVIWFAHVPGAAWLLALHAIGIIAILSAPNWSSRVGWTFRHWYPILFVACCYREMSILIPVVRGTSADQWLAGLDYSIWSANPTVWIERFQSPLVTELLQVIYTLFIPVVLLIPCVLWWRKRFADFRYTAFLLGVGFLVSYVGYLIVPARGPRFSLQSLQTQPLQGLWLFHSMQSILDTLEKAHYDCFPSGHTELTILACWSSRLISGTLFRVYFVYTLCIILATVYLRYHYSVDIMAGILVALVLILSGPAIYEGLTGKGDKVGAIEVAVVDGKSALKEFVELPFGLYKAYPHWVPPLRIAVKELLDRKKHPFYANADAEFFLARREGKVVGRIAAIIDRNHNSFHEENAGFFGFFECIDDAAVAKALLETARKWVTDRGAQFLRGPVNPSTNYECGMLTEGFDSSPMVMMTYNPPYYPRLMEAAGLVKEMDLFAWVNTADGVDLDKIGRVADRALARNKVTVRPINMKDFQNEVARVFEVYNAAWSRNWGFIPMSREEFFLMGKEMKQILNPEMVLIGESGGKIIGFALALPDINFALKPANGKLLPTGLLKILYYQRLIKGVRVLALGVVEEFRASGVAAGFYAALVRNARRLGYHGECEMSWILENNVLMTRALEVMGAKKTKTYRIYQWN